MKNLKILTMILAGALLLSIFVACKNDDEVFDMSQSAEDSSTLMMEEHYKQTENNPKQDEIHTEESEKLASDETWEILLNNMNVCKDLIHQSKEQLCVTAEIKECMQYVLELSLLKQKDCTEAEAIRIGNRLADYNDMLEKNLDKTK